MPVETAGYPHSLAITEEELFDAGASSLTLSTNPGSSSSLYWENRTGVACSFVGDFLLIVSWGQVKVFVVFVFSEPELQELYIEADERNSELSSVLFESIC